LEKTEPPTASSVRRMHAVPGNLAWVGLAAADAEVAVVFYAAAFGWEWVGADDRTMLRRAGADVALVYPQTPQARAANVTTHWTPFFSVADAGAAVDQAVQLGGMALREPFDVAGGRIAPLQDPAGAVFSLWAPRGPDPVTSGGGDAWWMELSTPDLGGSQAFYGQLLGWTYDESPRGASIRGPAGHIGRMRSVEGAPAWSACLVVTDIDDARRRADAAGARHVGDAEEDAIGRMAPVVDPQGAALTLLELTDSRHA
jgi:predicted enzyme related to lactoylglutathione lyase